MFATPRRLLANFLRARAHVKNWPMVLWLRYAARRPVVLSLRTGIRVACRPGTSDWTVVHEIALAGSYSRAFRHLETAVDGGIIVDLGANIGCFSLTCAALHPALQIVAYEPEPSNLSAFRTNLQLNPQLAGRITLVPRAVSADNGTAVLNVSSNLAGTNIIAHHRDASTTQLEVPVAGFPDVVMAVEQPIRLVKMDIEGSEFAIVKSTPAEAWARIPALAMEIHEDRAAGMLTDGLLAELASRGYRAESDRMGTWFLQRPDAR
jgi:FkbM family methyltransferase